MRRSSTLSAVALVVLVLTNILLNSRLANGHGWLMQPQPQSGGGTGSGNASTRSPCGKSGSNATVATFNPGETITVTYKRANSHGTSCNCVDFKLSYDAATAVGGPTNAHFTAVSPLNPTPLPLDVTTANPQTATIKLPNTAGKAVLQFKWQPTSGGAWFDCAWIEIANSGPCATNNGGCSTDAVCSSTSTDSRQCTCNGGFYGDGVTCTALPADVDVKLAVGSTTVSQDDFTTKVATFMQVSEGRVLFDRVETVNSTFAIIHFSVGADPSSGESGAVAIDKLRNAVLTGDETVHTMLAVQVLGLGVASSPIQDFGSQSASSGGGVDTNAAVIAVLVVAGILLVAGIGLYTIEKRNPELFRKIMRKNNGSSNSGNKRPGLAYTSSQSSSTSSSSSSRSLHQQVPVSTVSVSSTALTLPQPTSVPVAATVQELPPGWIKSFDDDGVPYYYNSNTNTSQWEPPTM